MTDTGTIGARIRKKLEQTIYERPNATEITTAMLMRCMPNLEHTIDEFCPLGITPEGTLICGPEDVKIGDRICMIISEDYGQVGEFQWPDIPELEASRADLWKVVVDFAGDGTSPTSAMALFALIGQEQRDQFEKQAKEIEDKGLLAVLLAVAGVDKEHNKSGGIVTVIPLPPRPIERSKLQ